MCFAFVPFLFSFPPHLHPPTYMHLFIFISQNHRKIAKHREQDPETA